MGGWGGRDGGSGILMVGGGFGAGISAPGGGAQPEAHFLKLSQLRRKTMADAVRSILGSRGQAVVHTLGPS